MKEKLEHEMLHTIVVNKNEMQWVKYKKEIIVGEKLFDVKSFTNRNGQYVFTGLFDEEETAFNKIFENSKNRESQGAYDILTSLFKMLQSMYVSDQSEKLMVTDICQSHFPFSIHRITSPVEDILTPPPQLAAN